MTGAMGAIIFAYMTSVLLSAAAASVFVPPLFERAVGPIPVAHHLRVEP